MSEVWKADSILSRALAATGCQVEETADLHGPVWVAVGNGRCRIGCDPAFWGFVRSICRALAEGRGASSSVSALLLYHLATTLAAEGRMNEAFLFLSRACEERSVDAVHARTTLVEAALYERCVHILLQHEKAHSDFHHDIELRKVWLDRAAGLAQYFIRIRHDERIFEEANVRAELASSAEALLDDELAREEVACDLFALTTVTLSSHAKNPNSKREAANLHLSAARIGMIALYACRKIAQAGTILGGALLGHAPNTEFREERPFLASMRLRIQILILEMIISATPRSELECGGILKLDEHFDRNNQDFETVFRSITEAMNVDRYRSTIVALAFLAKEMTGENIFLKDEFTRMTEIYLNNHWHFEP